MRPSGAGLIQEFIGNPAARVYKIVVLSGTTGIMRFFWSVNRPVLPYL
jgi:hypothetical protein